VIKLGGGVNLFRLFDDMNLWLVGGNSTVKATIILKWQTINNTNRVRGIAGFYTLDTNGIPIMRQQEPIFPPPPLQQQAQTQEIELSRRMSIGTTIFPERNP